RRVEIGLDQRRLAPKLDLHALGNTLGILGVKTLALSEPMPPEAMDALFEDAERIAKRMEVQLWRETALIETDLYPPSIARGKHVLLIYRGDTLEAYLALKQERAALVVNEMYRGRERESIARRFGRLLSYPDSEIDRLLERSKEPTR
ncbi:MAG: hypothetical protein AAFZ18_31510, partial [Myxococcota bacterium]